MYYAEVMRKGNGIWYFIVDLWNNRMNTPGLIWFQEKVHGILMIHGHGWLLLLQFQCRRGIFQLTCWNLDAHLIIPIQLSTESLLPLLFKIRNYHPVLFHLNEMSIKNLPGQNGSSMSIVTYFTNDVTLNPIFQERLF